MYEVTIKDSDGNITTRTCGDLTGAMAFAINDHACRKSSLLADLVFEGEIDFRDDLAPKDLLDEFRSAAAAVSMWWLRLDEEMNKKDVKKCTSAD